VPPRVYRIGEITYTVDQADQRVTTTWRDGVTLEATPVYDDASRETASQLGYGTTNYAVWLMTIDHDACHHWLAVAQGDPYSRHLRRVAEGASQPDKREAHQEECVVFLLQRLAARGTSHPPLAE
jgi:hypothetical protein